MNSDEHSARELAKKANVYIVTDRDIGPLVALIEKPPIEGGKRKIMVEYEEWLDCIAWLAGYLYAKEKYASH